MSPRAYTVLTAIIFLVVAAAHTLRLFTGFAFRVGTYNIPTWVSIIGLAVAGYLSYAGFRLAGRR